MTKPRSKAVINPTKSQLTFRHIGRIKRLREAIEKAEVNKQAERLENLQAELERRMVDINELKAELDAI